MSSGSSDSEVSSGSSDSEVSSASPARNEKKEYPNVISKLLPENTNDKKITTKSMVIRALIELNNRKGVSLYAIKKYLTEKYNFETEKTYLIKKALKTSIDDGTVTQIKGMGASGSFKIVPVNKTKADSDKRNDKNKTNNKKKVKENKNKSASNELKENKKKGSNSETKQRKVNSSTGVTKERKKKDGSGETKERKKKDAHGESKENKKIKPEKNMKGDVMINKTVKKTNEGKPDKAENNIKVPKAKKPKFSDGDDGKQAKVAAHTSTKKKLTMMKRKSIGSIIKTPKLKPQAIS